MDQMLVYADSLSWGLIPETRKRLPFDQRWPGVFENSLNARGLAVRVIENCLNGRRSVWQEPFNLESSVGRLPGCVPHGDWQGITRRNSRSIATSYNAVRRRAVRALAVVAAFTWWVIDDCIVTFCILTTSMQLEAVN